MASRRHVRHKECGRKRAYSTREEAERVCRGQGSWEGRYLTAYRCRWSHGGGEHWHVGHSDDYLGNPHGAKFAPQRV